MEPASICIGCRACQALRAPPSSTVAPAHISYTNALRASNSSGRSQAAGHPRANAQRECSARCNTSTRWRADGFRSFWRLAVHLENWSSCEVCQGCMRTGDIKGVVGEAGGHRDCDAACCVHCRAHAASLSRRQSQVPHCARPTPTRASLASHTECGASNRWSATPRRAHTTSSEPHMGCGSVHRAALESDCALRPTQLSLPPQRQPTAHAEGTFTSVLQRQSQDPMITSQQPKRPCGHPRVRKLNSHFGSTHYTY